MKRLLALACVVVSSALAQSGPSSVFGIELHQALAFPECKRETIVLSKDAQKWTHQKPGEEEWFYDTIQPKTCVEPEFGDKPQLSAGTMTHRGNQAKPIDSPSWWAVVFPIGRSPEMVSRDQLSTFMVDGKVEAIGFKTAPNDERVIAALAKKYGEPAGSSTRELQNGFGARSVVTFATWEHDGLLIRYCSGYCYPGEDDGDVQIRTKIAEEHIAKLRRVYDQSHPQPDF
jgi:hypothetical protein